MAVALPRERPRAGRSRGPRAARGRRLDDRLRRELSRRTRPSSASRCCAARSGSSRGAPRAGWRRRWSAASSCAPAACRSASCARAGSPAATCRSRRRGPRSARACTSTAAASRSRTATSCPPSRAATCCRRARCSCATATSCFERRLDPEGFSAGQAQFDSDITDGRHPRAALGLAPGRLVAVACDGRSRRDAGLTLEELARLLATSACHTALNLDGGGSTSLVSGGRLRNRPYAGRDRPSRAAARSRRRCCSWRARRRGRR